VGRAHWQQFEHVTGHSYTCAMHTIQSDLCLVPLSVLTRSCSGKGQKESCLLFPDRNWGEVKECGHVLESTQTQVRLGVQTDKQVKWGVQESSLREGDEEM
jgi:hypothetical protein